MWWLTYEPKKSVIRYNHDNWLICKAIYSMDMNYICLAVINFRLVLISQLNLLQELVNLVDVNHITYWKIFPRSTVRFRI